MQLGGEYFNCRRDTGRGLISRNAPSLSDYKIDKFDFVTVEQAASLIHCVIHVLNKDCDI
jgi:hypothetical protein